MLISVIIPVYNVKKFLPVCIESVLNQTYKNIEVILIDDGSSDGSEKLCDDFAAKDVRIRVVHQKNMGQSVARNVGLRVSKGDFIVFIDSDDFVLPHFLERLYKPCLEENVELSIGEYVNCDENGEISDYKESNEEKYRVFSENKMDMYFVKGKISSTVWAKLYRKSILQDFSFPKRKYCEDVYSTYMTIHLAKKIAISSYRGYVYRNNSHSVMNEKYEPRKKEAIAVCEERANFMRDHYPHLLAYAYSGVIYASNQVILSMGRSCITHDPSLEEIQFIYRKYFKYYLFSKATFFGKLFAMVSFVDVRIGLYLARFL